MFYYVECGPKQYTFASGKDYNRVAAFPTIQEAVNYVAKDVEHRQCVTRAHIREMYGDKMIKRAQNNAGYPVPADLYSTLSVEGVI